MKKLPKNLVVCVWVVSVAAGQALPALSRTESEQPSRIETAHHYLMDMYQKRREFDKAEREYDELLKLRPKDATLRYTHALFLAQTGKLGAALKEMDKARKLDPKNEDIEHIYQKIEEQIKRNPGDYEQPHPTRS